MLLHAQTFEGYASGTAGWTALAAREAGFWEDGGPGIGIVSPGWHVGRSLAIPVGNFITATLNPSANTRVLCFQGAFNLGGLVADTELFTLPNAQVFIAAGGGLRLHSAAGDVLSPVGLFRANEWHYFEIKAQIGVGSRVLVRIDGADVIDASGITTNGGVGYYASFWGAGGGTVWSELVIMDGSGERCNDLLGPQTRLKLLKPINTTPGSLWAGYVNATPTAGELHTFVDDSLPGASDAAATHVETNALAAAALFGFEPPPDARSYEAVTVLIEGTRTTSETPAFAAVLTPEIGTVQRQGALAAPDNPDYLVARLSLELNPHGSRPWTRQALRDLLAGVNTLAAP